MYEQLFLATKGLTIREVGEFRYIIEDVFGVCSLPYIAKNPSEIISNSCKIARTIPLIRQDDALLFNSDFYPNYWLDLEKYYAARLTDSYRIWQCGKSNYMEYDHVTMHLPIAYIDYGYGEGSKDTLELVDQETRNLIKNGIYHIPENFPNLRLMYLQISRICSDILSVLHRAITAFKNLLTYQRQAIKTQSGAMHNLEANEIIYTGPLSYDAATAGTIAVISLCTSLDLSSKLIYFINTSKVPIDKFKSAQGKHFSDIKNIKENVLSNRDIDVIKGIWDRLNTIKSLIQFRHDLIHNTAALELEKLYIGKGTEEIFSLPIYYSFQPWRDCEVNGQPIRYLGREYFVSKGIDFESQLCNWLIDVMKGHIEIGKTLLNLITNRREGNE